MVWYTREHVMRGRLSVPDCEQEMKICGGVPAPWEESRALERKDWKSVVARRIIKLEQKTSTEMLILYICKYPA